MHANRTATEELAALGSSRERGLSSAQAASRLERDGANEIVQEKRHPLWLLLKKFWGVSAWMIELVTLLSLLLKKYDDVWMALLLLVVNAVLSFLQEQHATDALAALRQRLHVLARVLRDGAWRPIPASDIVCGDVVRVRAGDFVPADLRIIEGDVKADQSALTGESQTVQKKSGDMLYSGSVASQGEASGVVTATGLGTRFGRTAQLVKDAQPRLHVNDVIAHVVRWLLIIVGSLVALTLVVALLHGVPLAETLPVALVVLMSAIPVALPVMFTVSTALGSMELAHKGVLITRLGAVEDAATMNVLCADKTGTLTLNRLRLVDALPQAGFSADDVIRIGAFAANAADDDPIDLAFLQAAKERNLLPADAHVVSFVPFSAATRCTQATVETPAGAMRCIKGALRTVAQAAALDTASLDGLRAAAREQALKGIRTLAVARADGSAAPKLVGLAYLHDAPRPDSRHLIEQLRALHVEVKMLTGDARPVGQEIAHELGLGEVLRAPELRELSGERATGLVIHAGGFAEVFPEDKYRVVTRLQAAGRVVGMTGDGVNDAPALKQAEVGIAVSGATDVAKAAASAVLTTEGLANIVALVQTGRAIYQRVLTWIVNKVADTILKAGLIVVAFLATGRFVISALGMLLVVLLTDFMKIALATDRVEASRTPETWNISPLIGVSVVLGLLMLGESLGLLAFGWHVFALSQQDGRLLTFTFQLLLFFALFSLLSIRERRAFWMSRPSIALMASSAAGALVGILIGRFGVGRLHALPLAQSLLTAGGVGILVLGPNDAVKVALIRRALQKMHHPLSHHPLSKEVA